MSQNQIWVRKYIPKKISEIEYQTNAVILMKNFVQNFKSQKKKGLLVHGPTGNGKTSSVYALANELNCELVEINASDFRNEEAINSILGGAAKQKSLFYSGKIILVDEIDGISGSEDRGGVSAIAKLLAETSFPIIMTANDPWDKKFSVIRNASTMVQFKTLPYTSVFKILKKICEAEKIQYEEESLKSLARRSAGDLRGAITDLQILSQHKKFTSAELEELSDREKEVSILNALSMIFKTTDSSIALRALDYASEDLDECFLWIAENLPKEYKNPRDLARAYDALSRADVLRGRIRRWQHWRFLAYISEYLTAGVAIAKDEKYRQFVQYTPTGRILKLWMANQKNAKKKAIAGKIAEKIHSSSRETRNSTLPYLAFIFKNSKKMSAQIADELNLDAGEVEWLRKLT
ncbi:MAG TPA: replication factor C large subunit [Candidatus Nanoarchaeia archaeon]|nr:replication factor C large subunit [Candidatus Nanoarchaeia archaeon]